MKYISIEGARQNNLKNLSVEIPRDCLVVVTGLSGAGKSSLVYDTIYAEAQRLFLESISVSAQQFLSTIARPDVDRINGLSPALAVRQMQSRGGSRSTVASLSDIYDFLKVLYANFGRLWCAATQQELCAHTPHAAAQELLTLPLGSRVRIASPQVLPEVKNRSIWLMQFIAQGFTRAIVGEEERMLDSLEEELDALDDLAIVVDRVVLKEKSMQRLEEAIALSYQLSTGQQSTGHSLAIVEHPDGTCTNLHFTERIQCVRCGLQSESLTPSHFSFHSQLGACPQCQGSGLAAGTGNSTTKVRGIRCVAEEKSSAEDCPTCGGSRLHAAARLTRVGHLPLTTALEYSVEQFSAFITSLLSEDGGLPRAKPLLTEIAKRLEILISLGLEKLPLGRSATQLSTGEFQRIQIARQLGSSLSGVLYIFDEPSTGLHSEDLTLVLQALRSLVERGNSVLVVEHDLDVISQADHIIELGPGAGVAGGRLIASGTPRQLSRSKTSVTAPFLNDPTSITNRRPPAKQKKQTMLHCDTTAHQWIAAERVTIPLEAITAVRGRSGTGKTRFLQEVLLPSVRSKEFAGPVHASIQTVIDFSEGMLGAGARSTPITLVGAFTQLRALYAELPEAKARGWGAGRFSFNVKGGRCEHCHGSGTIRLAAQLLPDLHSLCPYCNGSRYASTTEEVQFKGHSISKVLSLTVDEAVGLFGSVPQLQRRLTAMAEIGLGYLTLGQSAETLSGGELQRIRLAAELSKTSAGHTLYIFDEPTAGLHPKDISIFWEICQRLVAQRNTVVLAEHQKQILAAADWQITFADQQEVQQGPAK